MAVADARLDGDLDVEELPEGLHARVCVLPQHVEAERTSPRDGQREQLQVRGVSLG